MNRYPLWKYLIVLAAFVFAVIYALPNVFGEDPAIQISPTRTTKVDATTLARVERVLKQANIEYRGTVLDETSAKVRFGDPEVQLRARDLVQTELGDTYTVAVNLLPATPRALQVLGAKPMYLGLDLRGGVHFLMQVDTRAVLKKASENAADDIRRVLREAKVRYVTVNRLESGAVETVFRDAAQFEQARDVVRKELRDLELSDNRRDSEYVLTARMSEKVLLDKHRYALEQNITALRNRVNELGVAEPVIQQQGQDRIVVQLPGVQDTARAKEILGRTATLEIMLVDEGANTGDTSIGTKMYRMRDGRQIPLKNRVIYSGENIIDAAPGFDSRTNQSIVSITLDARGAAINQRVTGENVNKRMAVVYIEIKSKSKLDANGQPVLDAEGRPVRVSERVEEVITAPVIRQQLGKRFQIEGLDNTQEANELSLLLRAGALAAPVEIIEERTIGPSLGADNIQRGFHSTWIGFAAIAVFMILYYAAFGVISILALAVNVLLLLALLSIMQATLTLPGMAGIALTVGMAIDANVLINERIREELRNGNTPHASIFAGYERAFGTILDSNITTLIAGLALLAFGSGPVRGFAVVLCLGILTSMFSAVMVSRAIVNLYYGNRRKLERVAIGNTAWHKA
ncbi:MAG: protein translocase subunit SecD [Gammaproteobacteria bacterium]|nr:protein translocase subunit SecD [Gammaproteobacteria bacterium]